MESMSPRRSPFWNLAIRMLQNKVTLITFPCIDCLMSRLLVGIGNCCIVTDFLSIFSSCNCILFHFFSHASCEGDNIIYQTARYCIFISFHTSDPCSYFLQNIMTYVPLSIRTKSTGFNCIGCISHGNCRI